MRVTMSRGISKRQFALRFNANLKLVEELLERGVLEYLPNPSSPLRKRIDLDSLHNMKEGVHFVECKCCGGYQRKITARHLKYCSNLDNVDTYRTQYPNATIMSEWSKERHVKTEDQKRAQSEKLKRRFQTPEGEITRQQISQAAQKLMETGYREQAADHLREINQKPEQKEFLRGVTTERWENGDLREIVERWHEDNKELSNKLAFHARKHISKKFTGLHQKFKHALEDNGLRYFKTEHPIGYYHIDEAIPDLKLAVEVDGCFWHSCPDCGHEGPDETKAYDSRKESYLRNRGWTILRFWEHEINEDILSCIEQVKITVTSLNENKVCHDE